MKLKYSPRAIADINAIADYIRVRNPPAALRVGSAIEKIINLFRDNPGLGLDRPELGVRMISVPRYSYSVYYRSRADGIEIIHVRDDLCKPLEPGDV